jgi:ornithine--oxo-acid transaminase
MVKLNFVNASSPMARHLSIGMPKTTTVVDTQISTASSYSDYVNPQWVALLELLDMNVRYERCEGAELFTDGGRRILDFLSGYCVQNTGHNHPNIVPALQKELEAHGPVMLQSHVPELAAELAKRLCELAGAGCRKYFFAAAGARESRRRLNLRG